MKIKSAIAVIIVKDNKFLVSRRTNTRTFKGHMQFPGGEVDFGESEEDAVNREMIEETGMTVFNLEHVFTCSDETTDNLAFYTASSNYIPIAKEPDKVDYLRYLSREELLKETCCPGLTEAINFMPRLS